MAMVTATVVPEKFSLEDFMANRLDGMECVEVPWANARACAQRNRGFLGVVDRYSLLAVIISHNGIIRAKEKDGYGDSYCCTREFFSRRLYD